MKVSLKTYSIDGKNSYLFYVAIRPNLHLFSTQPILEDLSDVTHKDFKLAVSLIVWTKRVRYKKVDKHTGHVIKRALAYQN